MSPVSHEDLERMLDRALERAAKEGARKALAAIGLHDDNAGRDVGELRGLLAAWRDAKRTAWQTLVQALTKAVLIIAAAGLAWHWWGRP